MGARRPCPTRGLYRDHSCIATEVAAGIFRSLNNEFSNRAADLLSRGEYAAVVSLSVDSSTYSDVSDFRDDYLVAELMSKFPSWELGIDRKSVALSKFREAEQVCLETNHRLASSYGKASSTLSFASLLYTARRKIARLLGPLNWDEAEQHFGFGPGASTGLKRVHGDAYYKFGAKPQVTRECAVLAYTAVRRVPTWFNYLSDTYGGESLDQLFEVVPGNRITTVPKNAKTERTIAIEPDMNMYLQKGLGGIIRRRLKRVNVNLNDQTRNQELALEGSRTGALATIDLSSASDTVALRLVEELLPPDWFSAIEQCRSHRGVLPDGELITYQKVSSMGNGFTFELESLIFWALCSSVLDYSKTSERRLGVYGDDLIFSTDICDLALDFLTFCGFTVNRKKSFTAGPFRESCGKHYFRGYDVTPFYIREDVTSPPRVIWLANSIRRHARKGFVWGLDSRLHQVYKDVVSKLPKFWQQPRITDSLGDMALIGDLDECRPDRLKHGHEGFRCFGFAERRRSKLPDDVPFLLRSLLRTERMHRISFRSIEEWGSGDSVSEIGVNLPRRRPVWMAVKPSAQQWEDYGPWLPVT